VARVIVDPRQARDDHRDARQCPEVGREAGGDRPAPQRGLDGGQLARRQPPFAPGPAGRLQAGSAARAPGVIPAHDALATDIEHPRDRALRLLTAGEETRRVLPPKLQGAEVASNRTMSSHAAMVHARFGNVTVLCETQ
jgi:hypothetical protein